MSLYKRSSSPHWYIKITPTEGGKPIQRSTGTTDKRKAQEYHDRLKAELWNQVNLGQKPRRTWNEAVIRFVAEREELASIDTIKTNLRWLDPKLSGVYLVDIDRTIIDGLITSKRSEHVMIRTKDGPKSTGKKVSPGTVNRMIGVLMSVLNSAVAWEWITHAPKVSAVQESEKRVVWLTHEQASQLLAALSRHLSDMAKFSLETGLRRTNVTGLKWSQVDLSRKMAWIHPDEAKARKAIPVPLSDMAVEVLRNQRFAKRDPGYTDFVFVYRGKPVFKTSTRAWRMVCKSIGLDGFRWHDLRHTWASWHIQAGTPLHILQALGGWETERMVKRYAHLSADHLSQWVQSRCNLAVAANGK